MQRSDDNARLLREAEDVLTALTDECCGQCHWSEEGCACRDQFWPAIERIRKLRLEVVT